MNIMICDVLTKIPCDQLKLNQVINKFSVEYSYILSNHWE